MKKSGILMSALLAFGLLASCDDIVKTSREQIAFVDVQKVIRDSKAGQDLERQVKAYGDKVKNKARPEQGRLEREQNDLVGQRSVLSPAAFQKKENSFREKVIRFQQKMQGENQRLQKGAQESLSTIEAVLAQIYKELLGKHGLNMIINRGMVLDGDDDSDLTEEVIELLDKRLASVKLVVPAE